MSEEPGTYNTQGDNAAEIHPPKNIQALRDDGLTDYKVWGWVKMSAKFIYHIKKLRGAKLSVWQVIALSVDENSKCNLTIKELVELTGYSHTEVINSLKELDEMGYLSIDRGGKKNLYTPEFAARGIDNKPTETLVKKLDSTGVYQVESTPPLEKSRPSIKELKELKTSKPNFKELKPSDYRKIPEFKTFIDATGWVPGSFVLETVYNFIHAGLTLEKIAAAFSAWTARGYKPSNVEGYLTWARDGIPAAYGATQTDTGAKPAINTVAVEATKQLLEQKFGGEMKFVPRPENIRPQIRKDS